MKIDHLAIWVSYIERMRDFYLTYFDTVSNEKYINSAKEYTSYFISFQDGGCRLELMHRPDVELPDAPHGNRMGLVHFAVTVGSEERVEELTNRLRTDGYIVQIEPRTTGDGYFESVVLDPKGNWVEIIA